MKVTPQTTRKEIDDHYRAQGVDVDSLQKEFEEIGRIIDQAIETVRKRKHFLLRLFWSPFTHSGFGAPFKQEVRIEEERIKKELEKKR